MAGRNDGVNTGSIQRMALVLSVALVALVIGVLFVKVIWTDRQLDNSGEDVELSAWIVDWEWQSGLKNMQILGSRLSSLQLFAAYFDPNDQLYLTNDWNESISSLVQTARHYGVDHLYLTIVNDIIEADGSTRQKDSELVTRVTKTKERRRELIREIVDYVETYGLSGAEIDFEQIDDQAWTQVLTFYTELERELTARGKSLRIVLEPRVPFEKLNLPSGPQYVVMAYNLFGFHSGPGPKADRSFITQLIAKLDDVPGKPAIALAVGGFSWGEDGSVFALTEQQAYERLQQRVGEQLRDQESAAVRFQYVDENGMMREVWYADERTLAYWIETARQAGVHRIALWRLGGIRSATLDDLSQFETSVSF